MKNIELFYGDCVEKLLDMDNDSIDMIFTDIPYGINFKSHKQNHNTRSGRTIKIDREEYFSGINGDNAIPDIAWLKESYRILKPGTAIYICIHWETFGELKSQVISCGFTPKNLIVLNKSNHGMGDLRGQYAPKHEFILFAVKGRHILRFPNGRKDDVWNVPVKYSGSIRLHPNEKPVSWIIPAIENSSDVGDIILDPFMGSGSTGDAALKLGRKFIGMDNDQHYFDISKNRLDGVALL